MLALLPLDEVVKPCTTGLQPTSFYQATILSYCTSQDKAGKHGQKLGPHKKLPFEPQSTAYLSKLCLGISLIISLIIS